MTSRTDSTTHKAHEEAYAFRRALSSKSGTGRASLEAFLLPCIEQALNDSEENVVAAALGCLSALCVRGLLRKQILLETAKQAAPLLCHPAQWVRRAAVAFTALSASSLPPADTHAYLIPALAPLLRKDPPRLSSESSLLAALKPAVPKALFDMALSNAMLSASQALETSRTPPSAPPRSRGGKSRPGRVGDMSGFGGQSILEQWRAVQREGEGDEDVEKLKAMENYIKNSSSTMQMRMRNWESENAERLKGSGGSYGNLQLATANPNARATAYSMLEAQTSIPVYSVMLSGPDSRPGTPPNGTPIRPAPVNEDWGRIFGVRTNPPQNPPLAPPQPTNQSWASVAAAQSSLRASQHLQKSIALVNPMLTETRPRPSTLAKPGGERGGDNLQRLIGIGGEIGGQVEESWRPRGVLVANLVEHKKSVTRIATSDDNTFFVSGSIDGSVKIWDCRRLERDLAFKARLTFEPSGGWQPEGGGQGGGVLSVSVLENSHTVAAATSTGQLHVFRVDYASSKPTSERYSGFLDTRTVSPEEGAVLALEPLRSSPPADTPSPPLLLYSTQRGGVKLWDLRAAKDSWRLKVEPSKGVVSGLAVDYHSSNWVVTATSRGLVMLWDLRFQIPVHSWQHPYPVSAITPLHPGVPPQAAPPSTPDAAARPLVYIAAGKEEVGLWNAEDGTCQTVFRVCDFDNDRPLLTHPPSALSPPRPLPPPNSSKGRGLPLPGTPPLQSAFALEELHSPPPRLGGPRTLLPLAGGVGVLAGGTDCRIRAWNRLKPELNYVVCGPTLRTNGRQLPQPTYDARLIAGVRVMQEVPAPGTPSSAPSLTASSRASGTGLSTVVAAAALDTAGCHRDCVTALASAQVSQRILISGGRDGTIKVWK